jgi:hypothetical protein
VLNANERITLIWAELWQVDLDLLILLLFGVQIYALKNIEMVAVDMVDFYQWPVRAEDAI